MNQIIDFKKRQKNWSADEKYTTIGKFFYNEASSEYLVIVDITETQQGSDPDVKVGRVDGTIKKTKWRHVAAQRVPWGTRGHSKDVILSDEEAKPYAKYISSLRDFLNEKPVEPKEDPHTVEAQKPTPVDESGAEKLISSLYDIIKKNHKYVALINGRLVAHNRKKQI